MPHSDYGMCAV